MNSPSEISNNWPYETTFDIIFLFKIMLENWKRDEER